MMKLKNVVTSIKCEVVFLILLKREKENYICAKLFSEETCNEPGGDSCACVLLLLVSSCFTNWYPIYFGLANVEDFKMSGFFLNDKTSSKQGKRKHQKKTIVS